MLTSITSFFQKHLATNDHQPKDAETHRARLAAAALLVEVVHSDYEISAAERQAVLSGITRKFDLSQTEADELIALAEEQAKLATDLHQFTSQINRQFDAQQKLRLIEELWHVAYADGALHHHEEHLIRKVADLIHVSHSAFIAAKHRAKNSAPS
ncbi:MAG: TerB family tellurite resistance protein [Candidatus Obscuribacterales bacterium]|nr:TerB family tellurite resistance protein [Steroidobacteraceae bacterium]